MWCICYCCVRHCVAKYDLTVCIMVCVAGCRESLSHAAACVNLRALDLGANQIELFSELRFLQSLEHLEALTLQVCSSNDKLFGPSFSVAGSVAILTCVLGLLGLSDLESFRITPSRSRRRTVEKCSLCFRSLRVWTAAT